MYVTKKTSIYFLALILIVAISVTSVNAETLSVNHKKIVGVPDYGNCTSAQGMEVVGGNLYAIKHDGNGKTAFIKILDFVSSPKTTKYYVKNSSGNVLDLKKPNGIAYYDGDFYIPTTKSPGDGSQVLAVSSKGVLTKKLTADKAITSITYYKSGQFIVGASQPSDGIRKYYIATISGTKINLGLSFTVKVAKGYVGNDITYTEGNLYIPMFNDIRPATLYQNRIYTVNLSSGITAGKEYSSSRTLIDNGSKGSQYEIEGTDIANGKTYIITNQAGGDNINQLYKP